MEGINVVPDAGFDVFPIIYVFEEGEYLSKLFEVFVFVFIFSFCGIIFFFFIIFFFWLCLFFFGR